MANLSEQITYLEGRFTNESHNIKSLQSNFEKLIDLKQQAFSKKDILKIENFKLRIIKAILKRQNYDNNYFEASPPKPSYRFKKASVITSLCFATIASGLAGFFTTKTLLALFINAASPLLLVASVAVGLAEALMFVVSDAREISHAYGMPMLSAKARVKLLKQQMKYVKELHQLLLDSREQQNKLKSYLDILKVIHSDLSETNTYLQKPSKTTIVRRVLKGFYLVISATLAMSSGYLLAKSTLAICAAGLLTSPIGWVICGASTLFSLGAYFFMRKKSVARAIDNIMGHATKFKKDLQKFVEHDIKDFNNKMIFKPCLKPMIKIVAHNSARARVINPVPINENKAPVITYSRHQLFKPKKTALRHKKSHKHYPVPSITPRAKI